ncbi:MAG: type IV pilus modification protein PilV [Gallionella sp.]|nr:type IV pilus modification protein PilV [Gallionella sp.]
MGFSMLEILVTLVIVGTALLGTAGLQAYAMKMNLGSQYRNQAVFLANDIAERMEGNRKDAITAPGYAAPLAGAAKPCDTPGQAICTPAELTQFDLQEWQAAVAAILPQGTGTITQTVPGNPATYTIVVTWVDRATDQQSVGPAVANGGTGENFAVTTTKWIRY